MKLTVKNYTQESNLLDQKIQQSYEKFPDETDFISCKECGYRARDLVSHLRYSHNISRKDYVGEIRCATLKTEVSKRTSGENNPGFQHGGKLSPFSKKFVGVYDEKIFERTKKSRKDNGTESTSLAYFMKKTHGDEKLAKEMHHERQTTFSLEKCILKHGEKKGTKVWNDRQTKWLNNFTKNNFSKVSQELFTSIMELFDNKDVYFAIYKNPFDSKYHEYKNKEFRLKLKNRSVLPDFYVPASKKIIEFDGDYWHRDNIANPTHEADRQKAIEEDGYGSVSNQRMRLQQR